MVKALRCISGDKILTDKYIRGGLLDSEMLLAELIENIDRYGAIMDASELRGILEKIAHGD